jgi:hypothetical protein
MFGERNAQKEQVYNFRHSLARGKQSAGHHREHAQRLALNYE